MHTFLAKRILQLIPTLFFVSVLIFSLQQLLPGDPALIMAGEDRDPDVIEQIRKQYHLDQPIPVQYVYWIKGALSGDLGESMRFKQPVLDLVLQKLPVTMQLASMAIIIALSIGITAGIISAVMGSDCHQVLALSTMFTKDVFAHYGGKEKFGERGSVYFARA